jgi:ferrous iron transport protein B
MRQRVGNYPGVTVETKKGRMSHAGRSFDLIDLPGTYSLAPRSPDEMVAVDLILGHQAGEPRPDVVLSLVDASNLERNLYLTTQALELGVPVVVALNMIDVAQGQGLRIDAEKLSQQLGVLVVPIQANKGRGLDQLKQAIGDIADCRLQIADLNKPDLLSRSVPFPDCFEKEASALEQVLGNDVPRFLVRRLLLDVGGYIEQRLAGSESKSAICNLQSAIQGARQRLAAAGCSVPAVEARARYGWIRQVTAGCIQRPAQRPVTWTDRLDRVLTHKVWGTLVFLILMFVVFQSIFTWARPLMDLIDQGREWLGGRVEDWMAPGPLRSLLTEGMLKGVGSVLMFLPQIIILFAFIAVLEDCGYMARAAFLMDKLMARCGLSGKSFIPLLSSVACAVPGIMATRVIENRRDRLATILVAPLMSCSARLPVYILLIGAFLTDGHAWWVPGLTMFAMYAVGLVVAPLMALLLKRTLLRGETPVFIMEMPLYKLPSLRTVLRRMTDSAWAFVRRAGTLILASMILVWALLYFPSTNAEGVSYPARIAELEEPITEQKKELQELEKNLAEEKKELARLQGILTKRAEPARLSNLFGLLSPSDGEAMVAYQAIPGILSRIAIEYEPKIKELKEVVDPVTDRANELTADWKKNSLLGHAGQAIEPVVKPLGWDWRIGMAALASFPAREVVVGTLGIIYNLGEVKSDEIRDAEHPGQTELGKALLEAHWDGSDRKVFTIPVALSLMVFFALCCQCASTLAVIKRETRSWRWPIFTFVYMTVLAYIGALLVYQLGTWISGGPV